MKHFIVINSFSFLSSHFLAYMKSCTKYKQIEFEVFTLETYYKTCSVNPIPVTGLNGRRSSIKGIFQVYTKIIKKTIFVKNKSIEIIGIQLLMMLFPILLIQRFRRVIIYVPGIGYTATESSRRVRYRMVRSVMRFVFFILRNKRNVTFIFENTTDAKNLHKDSLKSNYKILPGVGSVSYAVKKQKRRINESKNIKIIFVGRLLRDKGVLELINAINIFNSLNNQFLYHLKLFGSIDPKNPNSLTVSDLQNLGNQYISFEGFHPEIYTHLNNSDVFILPSYREGFPKAGIEAAINGIPLILTNCPGCKDLYDIVGSGVIIEPRSVEAIVAGLIEYSQNQVNLKRQAMMSIKRLITILDEDRIAEMHLGILRDEL